MIKLPKKNQMPYVIIVDPGDKISDEDRWLAHYIFGRTITGQLELIKGKEPIVGYTDKFRN
jgi:hypothetical protein